MKLIERDAYLNSLIDVIGTPDIKVITGVRRSGKSKLLERFKRYILETNVDANIIHINFNLAQYETLKEYEDALIVPMMDARRSEVYTAVFDKEKRLL